MPSNDWKGRGDRVGCTSRRLGVAAVASMAYAGYHGLGQASGTVDRHWLQTLFDAAAGSIYTESRVLSYASAHARLGEFHDNSGKAADEKANANS
jgi:hypothetical protein